MATIDDWGMIEKIINNNGHFEGDPQIQKVVEYTNLNGGKAWGIIYPWEDLNKYHASEYVINPKTIWEARSK